MNQSSSRRECLKSIAAATAFTVLPSRLARSYQANEKLNVAMIGVAHIGRVNRLWLKKGRGGSQEPWPAPNIVALCDVDQNYIAEAAPDHPGAKTWTDYRKMLDGQKEIDAVVVSTPDHTHAVISMTAMKHGKHVCTEKPLAHSVFEARTLASAAKKHGVATQLDNEGHAADSMRTIVELTRSGLIGAVHEVHIWEKLSYHPQGQRVTKPVPTNLDWDLWLGPAPYRDYHDGLHPFTWRRWWDFGTAVLGDFGCHFFDAAFWALQLGHPETVEAESEGCTQEKCPKWSIVTYRFPARGEGQSPVTLRWFDGGKLPPLPEELPREYNWPSGGSIFIGTEGKLLVQGTSTFRLLPQEKFKDFEPPAPYLPRVPRNDHKLDWLRACQGGPPASSNFADYGGPLAEAVLLGNVAVRAGKQIEWDPVNLRAKNAPEADQYIRREYRKGWNL